MSFLGGSASVSNLCSFLDCTTPVVASQPLPKTCFGELNRLWQRWDSDKYEFFTLQDVWSCYDEWSAYGAGTPILLNGQETLVQYYVPYLSAIQIFTSTRTSMTNIGNNREDAESETRELRDSWSDDTDSDKLWRCDGGCSEDCSLDQYSRWQMNDKLGYLYFQSFERCTPYGRVPLMDKISGLAQEYPGLMTLKSIDLSPASWMAVAWYPIYHIPAASRSVKDLSTCFLTYHTLSSSFQEIEAPAEMECTERKRRGTKGIALRPFGLATYKMRQRSLWVSGADNDRLWSLLSAADSWLKQLRVQHHDFNYFNGLRPRLS